MSKARELVELINAAEILSPHFVDDIDTDIESKYVDEVDEDERRWYTIKTMVLMVDGEYVGVRGPMSLKSESSYWSDIDMKCEAFEMEQVPSVTYKRKAVA